jgi:hypothetical protein
MEPLVVMAGAVLGLLFLSKAKKQPDDSFKNQCIGVIADFIIEDINAIEILPLNKAGEELQACLLEQSPTQPALKAEAIEMVRKCRPKIIANIEEALISGEGPRMLQELSNYPGSDVARDCLAKILGKEGKAA